MKPLQSVAMGFVFIALYARLNGYDLYADPVGWVLVLLGVRRLPADLPHRTPLQYVGAVAAAVSVPMWFPVVRDALADADASLGWAADLPAFAFTALLCHALAAAAEEAGDVKPSQWLALVRTVVVAVAVLPVLVFGAGISGLADPAALAAQAVYVVLVWLLFSYSGRTWSGAPVDENAAQRPQAS
ncbi:hypothetical protein NSZ01_30040 [Nocardioides szechwanensis]|uniref:Uncharacterized protein n=1 Tax=Nocardioides szechwanensis TaxID=1005944 RepID=A0A1H0DTH6_9ACTN|nr:hypothetical protein [Nocardioides szechwanensis]GEP35236.1 hypothetical protein NSZ01_30040 [Nocardioides szechwanensis]SDN73291.1 hypothetical protein SAMN05192576_2662 [Nocardioides szechwanensis]